MRGQSRWSQTKAAGDNVLKSVVQRCGYVMSEHVVGEVVSRVRAAGSQVGPMLANPAWMVVSFRVSAGQFPDPPRRPLPYRPQHSGRCPSAWGPCQRVDDVRLPELPMPQGDCPTAARRPDGPALTSGAYPAARQQAALAMRTRSTSRRRTKNIPGLAWCEPTRRKPLLLHGEFRGWARPGVAAAPVTCTTGWYLRNRPELAVSA